jgi:hypothetical protein
MGAVMFVLCGNKVTTPAESASPKLQFGTMRVGGGVRARKKLGLPWVFVRPYIEGIHGLADVVRD